MTDHTNTHIREINEYMLCILYSWVLDPSSEKKRDSFLEEGAERIHTHQFLGSLVNDEIPKVACDLRSEVVGIKVKQKIL